MSFAMSGTVQYGKLILLLFVSSFLDCFIEYMRIQTINLQTDTWHTGEYCCQRHQLESRGWYARI